MGWTMGLAPTTTDLQILQGEAAERGTDEGDFQGVDGIALSVIPGMDDINLNVLPCS